METELSYRPGALFLAQAYPPSPSQWALQGERMAIGRDPACDVHLADSRISWHHADLVRHGYTWSITDAQSTNGTFVNGTRVHESVLRPRDRIRLGQTEFVISAPAPSQAAAAGPPTIGQRAVSYDVGSQYGNINNVAGDQANYYHESNLRYIASKRGRARALIVWGILLFFLGNALGTVAVLQFDSSIFNAIGASGYSPPNVPKLFFPLVGLGVLMSLLGIFLFIFGLIARSGVKKEARRLRVDRT
ncbi:MAG TPA: FHA domain-containing protein [Streptosporangiaceae bacterium]|jgi:hypothetical protein